MLKQLTHTQVWVHDQDEALAFYTEKLGLELRDDVTVPELGNFRWLTVGPVGQDDFAIVLMAIPGPPVYDTETSEQIRTLLAKGGTSTVFLVTDDCRKAYDDLSAQGVEFTQPPADRPYGVEAVMRDNSGNWLVLVEQKDFRPEDFGKEAGVER